jgi:proteic killer suppression protein
MTSQQLPYVAGHVSTLSDFPENIAQPRVCCSGTTRVHRFPNTILKIALRKLDVINGAHQLDDLRSPPAALKGDLSGFLSIQVNDQWRVIFRWDSGAKDVSLIDYH